MQIHKQFTLDEDVQKPIIGYTEHLNITTEELSQEDLLTLGAYKLWLDKTRGSGAKQRLYSYRLKRAYKQILKNALIRYDLELYKMVGKKVVKFSGVPFLDVMNRIVYIFKGSVTIGGSKIVNTAKYNQVVKLLKNNKHNLSQEILRVIEIDLSNRNSLREL